MTYSMKPARFFGVRWSLNKLIGWANFQAKEYQKMLDSFKITKQLVRDQEQTIQNLEVRIEQLEENLHSVPLQLLKDSK